MHGWTPTRIEELKVFDIVYHGHAVYVIRRISRNSDGQKFEVTSVDEGKLGTWNFHPYSHGYLMDRKDK